MSDAQEEEVLLSDIASKMILANASAEDKSEKTREHFLNNNNIDRAERALQTVRSYWTDSADEGLETILGDLLGDLQHLCRLTKTDFEEALRRGYNHHGEERDGIY
jgi:hypothetical protein